MARRSAATSNLCEVLRETYAANDHMNQLLLKHLDARAWRAKAPGMKTTEGRTIAAIFAHMHNNRLVWLKRSAPHLKCPAPLDPAGCTIKQAASALRKSDAGCLKMLEAALLENPDRRVTKFSLGGEGSSRDADLTVTLITGARSSPSLINSAIVCPTRPLMASGTGTRFGKSWASPADLDKDRH